MTTSQEIRQRILALEAASEPADPVPVVRKSPKKVVTIALGACILILSIATYGAILFKSNNAKHTVSPVVKTEPAVTRSDVESLFSNFNERFDKSDKRIDMLSNRIWLLGVAHNENINLIAKREWQQFGLNSNYIVFDEAWKINRIPEIMTLPDDVKEKLMENVK